MHCNNDMTNKYIGSSVSTILQVVCEHESKAKLQQSAISNVYNGMRMPIVNQILTNIAEVVTVSERLK